MAGFMAENHRGRPGQAVPLGPGGGPAPGRSVTLLDARTPMEYSGGCAQGFVNIPVDELRQRLGEIGNPHEGRLLMCRAGCGAIWPAASWPSTGMTATTSPAGIGSMPA